MIRIDTKRINPGPVTFRSNLDIAIHVPDLAQAEAFYGDVMGFRLVTRTQDHLEYDTGALRLYINRGDPSTSFVPSLDVTDLEAARLHLVNSGCELIPQPNGGLYVRDPLGFVFDIVECLPE